MVVCALGALLPAGGAARAQSFTIGGQVTDGTNGLSGVTMTGGADATTTDANGRYSLTNLAGAVLVTPSEAGQIFNPMHQALTAAAGLTNINFVRGVSNVTTVVATCDQPSLAVAVALGGLAQFGANGDLRLTNQLTVATNLVLDGTNHQVILDGGGSNRIAYVNAGVSFTLANLTCSNGFAQYDAYFSGFADYAGGAILNDDANLLVTGCAFINNACGSLSLTGAVSTAGGAIWSYGGAQGATLGSLAVAGCSFIGNLCITGFQTNGVTSSGGAIENQGGTLAVASSSFIANSARSVYASGGAIYSTPFTLPGTAASFTGCLFDHNFCLINSSNQPGLYGAYGGAIFSEGLNHTNVATLSALNCTFVSNTVSDLNTQSPAAAENAIDCLETAFYTNNVYLTNCTFAGNTTGSSVFQTCLSTPTSTFIRGCVFQDANAAGSVYEFGGSAFVDLGFNLAGSNPQISGTSYFTNGTSHTGVNAMLGPLANNGSQTLTCAPLPGSPCIDAITNGYYPPTDQRGFTRPYGKAADIGAVEYYPDNFIIRSLTAAGGDWTVQGYGFPLTTFRLLSSMNLTNWLLVETNATGPNGLFSVLDTSSNAPRRFYQTANP